MPALVDGSYVRTLGGLPDEISDERLLPHIESAERLVWNYTGFSPSGYATLGENVQARLREAVGCFAIRYALPVLNTFYLDSADRVPRDVAETSGYLFHDAADVARLARMWEQRGYEALRGIRSGGVVTATVI